MDEADIVVTGRVRIPASEIAWEFAHSGGPGGQNVNKVSSQARLRWDVEASEALGPDQKRRVRAALGNRITKEGVLQITAAESRSQLGNRRIAKERFRELLAEALRPAKRRKRTRPTRAGRERRLDEKKRQAEKKQRRRSPGRDAVD